MGLPRRAVDGKYIGIFRGESSGQAEHGYPTKSHAGGSRVPGFNVPPVQLNLLPTCTTMSLLSSTLHSCLQTSRFFSNGVITTPGSFSSNFASALLHSRNALLSTPSSSSAVMPGVHGGRLGTRRRSACRSSAALRSAALSGFATALEAWPPSTTTFGLTAS